MSDTRSAAIGPSFLLFVLFLYLKLTDQISWGWAAVTAPLWVPAAVAIPLVIVFAVLAAKAPTRKPPYIR